MGLFGYNEKDFARNTDTFKTQIESMMPLTDVQTRRVLTRTIMLLGDITFAGTGKKELESIDNKVKQVIDEMLTDARKHNVGSVFERSNLLFDLIEQDRQYGKTTITSEVLERREKMANIHGEILDMAKHKEEIIARQKQILEESEEVSEDSAEYDGLRDEYDRLSDELEDLLQVIDEYREEYNIACESVRALDKESRVEKLESNDVVSVQALTRSMEKTTQKIEQIHARRETKREVLDEAKATFSEYSRQHSRGSSFDAAKSAKREQDISSAVEGSSAHKESSFDRARSERR